MHFEPALGFVAGTVLFLACVSLGDFVITRLPGVSEKSSLAIRAPVAAAVGASVLSFGAYGVFALGVPNRLVILSVCFVCIGLGLRFFGAVARGTWSACTRGAAWKQPAFITLAALSAAVALLCLLNGMRPATEGDALQGYMFTGRWIAHHGLTYSPFNPRYSLMPVGVELLYALGFVLGNDIAPKVTDYWLGLMMIVLVYGLARTRSAAPLALAAAASLMVADDFQNNWANGKVDVTASFIFISSFAVIAPPAALTFSTVAVAAFLAGAACGMKYTFWIMAPALVAYIVYRSAAGRRNLRFAAAAVLIIGAAIVPHCVKNIVWTGNPLAPFATDVIPSHNIYLGHDSDAIHADTAQWALFPLVLFFNGGEFPWIGPFPLLVLAGAVTLIGRGRRDSGALQFGVAVGLILSFWIIGRRGEWLVPRFLLSATGLALATAAIALSWKAKRRRWIMPVVVAGAAGLLLYSGLWRHRHWRAHWQFAAGLESRASWQSKVPHRGYPALHALGPKLGSDRRIFIGASIYNLPEDKLQYASTEAEVARLLALPEEMRRDFLRQERFGYYYDTSSEKERWTEPLRTIYESGTGGGMTVRILCTEIAEPCEPLTVESRN